MHDVGIVAVLKEAERLKARAKAGHVNGNVNGNVKEPLEYTGGTAKPHSPPES